MKSKATEQIGMRIEKELKERLLEISEKQSRTLSNLIILVLEDYADRYEKSEMLYPKI